MERFKLNPNPVKAESFDERREFFRIDFRNPVKFRHFEQSEAGPRLGTIENVSVSGILFKSRMLPPISTVLWMDLDLRTLKICQEIEALAVVREKGILGRVVRVEEDPEERLVYNIGVCFLRKDDLAAADKLGDFVL